ncbi:Holliday junction resolvase RuvX [Cellulomonas sp. HLT2-17]|uniref:Putative pre-16S rRNA nuclease n=1 Tax=Pengzhenrongella frigida TaxID=1259133 RepID=A0A4Q5N408_9MICO|nr:Holliday junction resolvase RuvX [Cellulomonas sp. HLT2-17]
MSATTRVDRGVRLGVDVGSVRVGLATSDPDGMIATPIDTLRRPKSLARIVREVADRGAVIVYVGLPVHLSGAEGSASEAARNYAGALASAVAPVAVRLVDERMSTVSAHRALHESGRAGRSHRQVVDQAAAVVILQSALEKERVTGARAGEPVAGDPAGANGHPSGIGEATER